MHRAQRASGLTGSPAPRAKEAFPRLRKAGCYKAQSLAAWILMRAPGRAVLLLSGTCRSLLNQL